MRKFDHYTVTSLYLGEKGPEKMVVGWETLREAMKPVLFPYLIPPTITLRGHFSKDAYILMGEPGPKDRLIDHYEIEIKYDEGGSNTLTFSGLLEAWNALEFSAKHAKGDIILKGIGEQTFNLK